MRKSVLAAVYLMGTALSGCAQFSTQTSEVQTTPDQAQEPAQAAEKTQAPKPEPSTAEIEHRDFEPDILYALLAAEMAAQRGRFDVTLVNYVEAAKRTYDPSVIRRAMAVARGLSADNAQYQLAKTWLEIEPQNIDALRVASVQAIKHQEYELAHETISRILSKNESPEFDNLGAFTRTQPPEQQAKLIELFQKLNAEYPESDEISLNLAILHAASGQRKKALEVLAPVLETSEDYLPAKALYATLLFESGERGKALRFLRRQTRRYPDSLRLGTLHARMLVEDNQIQAAEDAFGALKDRFPENSNLNLSYALVALENDHLDIAERELQKLVQNNHHVSDAHFYLGRIARERDNPEKAMEHFRQVTGGSHFLSARGQEVQLMLAQEKVDAARERLAELRDEYPKQARRLWLIEINALSDAGYKEEAIDAATEALKEQPENTTIRYARAMIRDEIGRHKGAEQDFRQIIELEPKNAVALNALGYTLTIRTERYEEALEFIQKAHELAPNNPAIIDSLGWVHYKMGNTEKALEYLKEAYEQFPDPEVAAHLGEVLWVLGRKDDARRVWRAALEESPGDERIINTLERLDATLEAQ